MKAVYIESHGGPEALIFGERPDPALQPNCVTVRVKAASLNRLDVYTRAGVRGMKREFPPSLVLGGDSSGEVAEVGPGVTGLKEGDRVIINPRISCGHCSYCLCGKDDLCSRSTMLGSQTDGSYAEYVTVPQENAVLIADAVTYEEAAAVPTTYLPVWNMIVRHAQLQPWETVLALSASAGVGAAAIQVAKDVIGARVITTTSSEEKAVKARELGADEVINYKEEDIAERVKELTNGEGVDVVVDHVGAEFFPAAFASLKRGGRYGNCGVTTGYRAELHLGMMFTKAITVFGLFMGSHKDMQEITHMLNKGKIKPAIHEVFPLEKASEAHEAMESLNFFGKLVLNP